MTTSIPLVSVIIVSYNTRPDTVKAIKSVLASTGFGEKEVELIVVDNHSNDDSVATIKSTFKDVKVIANQSNLGFGGGNNRGVQDTTGKYILFLNSDAILSPNSLRVMVDELISNQDLISVGPQLVYLSGQLQPSAGYLPTPPRVLAWMWWLDKLPLIKQLFRHPYHIFDLSWYTKDQNPDWIMGACIMFRREEFLQVGGFDENIFMYSEEVELYRRLKEKFGKRTLLTTKTKVTHIGSVSTKKADASRLVYELKGIFYIYKKHYPHLLWFIYFVIYTGVIMRMIVFCLIPSRRAIVSEYKKLFTIK